MSAYTHQMARKAGEAYYEILRVLNKKDPRDCFAQTSDIFPIECLVMQYKKAVVLGLSKEANQKMLELCELIDIEDMHDLMRKPIPREMAMDFELGMMFQKEKSRKS